MAIGKILAIDDEKHIRHLIESEFSIEGFAVTTAGSAETGLRRFEEDHFDVVFLDIKLPEMDGIEALKRLKQKSSATDIIMITGHGDIASAVTSMKLGARDYVTKPFKLDELLTLTKQTVADRKRCDAGPAHKAGAICRTQSNVVRCPSPAMAEVYAAVERVAPKNVSVLIQGETGVGKDVLASHIHQRSARHQEAFVVLDCGLLNQNLAESELYGHRKGAFSGAGERKLGLVELSHHGTLFLDEIGNIDLNLQKKFLRFIETGRFRRVGETKENQVDTRLILATNVDLYDAVQKGQLRQDLLYRMDVFSITIPPLRRRRDDIPVLAAKMVEVYSDGGADRDISGEAMEILCQYDWPGNIRELRSVITKALIFGDTDVISACDLPRHVTANRKLSGRKPKTLEEMEKNHIIAVLAETAGNQSKAAELLGINRKTLYKKIQKYKIFS
ncbi:MAG: sigma-54 dependent transcriptional regulator [Desulfosarcinaceae bacterium]|nr:sigma-54 dependent transcriptional regulator [Desulfosarcinaceae bacterium]